MIRSSRIPPLLNRICTDGIVSSYLITTDGELLGCSDAHLKISNVNSNTQLSHISSQTPNTTSLEDKTESWEDLDPSDISALVAEAVDDYRRLGIELSLLSPQNVASPDSSPEKSQLSSSGELNNLKSKEKDRGRLNCLIIEMEKGLLCVASATSSTYVVALTDSTAQHGYLKMKLTALASYVREAFLPIENGSM